MAGTAGRNAPEPGAGRRPPRGDRRLEGDSVATDYPGNPALAGEVKQRVLATFRQTLELYNQGLLDEVEVGCDFLTKMDPLFEPARRLLEKAKNPAANIDVMELMKIAGAEGSAQAKSSPFSASGPAAGGADVSAQLAIAREALAAREFQRAVEMSSMILRTDMMNEQAQRIAEQASERLEAEPFIQQFASKARVQIEAGDMSAARAILEKGRALDPDHPLMKEIHAEIERGGAAGYDPMSSFGVPAAAGPAPEAPPASFDFGTFTPEAAAAPPPPPSSPKGFDFSADSFVVDTGAGTPPAGAGRTGAASDFGFTFEEDQSAAPISGFDSPAAPPAQTSPGEFDFPVGSVDVSREDQTRIDDFLRQGDAANEAGESHKAIDLWSRIFLIDVTNEQASQRIEKARARRVELDRKADDLLSQAATALARNDRATARQLFEKVIEIDPDNADATEHLRNLGPAPAAELGFGIAGAAAATTAAPDVPPRPAPRAAHPFDEPLFPEDDSSSDQVLVPPSPGSARDDDEDSDYVEPARAAKAKAPSSGGSKTLIFAAIGLLLLLGIGFGAWKMFFSGDGAEVESPDDTIASARQLAERGNVDAAIAALLAIPSGDPRHEEALTMVAELRVLKAQSAGTIRPAGQFSQLVEQGRAAAAINDYKAAKLALEQAAAIQPLPPDVKAIYDRVAAQANRLETAENLFKSGSYREALGEAGSLLAEQPGHVNARQLVRDAHFNLGVQALQQEQLQNARAEFDQVLAIDPTDQLAQRGRELAIRYEDTPKDLLYRIFVKYLKLR